jgi:P22_AR N-terminal domain/ORF6C domain
MEVCPGRRQSVSGGYPLVKMALLCYTVCVGGIGDSRSCLHSECLLLGRERETMSEQENRVSRVGNVIKQATAVFEGAEITAVLAEDGFIYASLPHLCRALGLDAESQRHAIDDHVVLTEGLLQFPLVSGVRIVTTWCLRANLIALWLALVPTKRLKAEKQERIVDYQRKAADTLDRLFGVGPHVPVEGTTTAVVEAAPAYAEGLAIARMATEQAQQALQKAEEASAHVVTIETRLMALEARFMPREQVSEEQAERISDLVKQAAIALSAKLGGGNYFGTVYGQLYRTFGVTSYKLLTMAQYPKAVAWLEKMIKENH